jgi:hypothetical protein
VTYPLVSTMGYVIYANPVVDKQTDTAEITYAFEVIRVFFSITHHGAFL